MSVTATGASRADVITWTDAQTGREVRRFPRLPAGARMMYFRQPKRLPDQRMLLPVKGTEGRGWVALDPETGAVEAMPLPGGLLRLREADGLAWSIDREQVLWQTALPGGAPERLGQLAAALPGHPCDITCDGRHVLLADYHNDEDIPPPHTKDAAALFAFFNRRRHGALHALELASGRLTTLVELPDMLPIHPDASPADPGQVKFSHDRYDAHCQRIWTVRTDGSELTPVRPQAWNELITHEFWWPDGTLIGFKYQDRREDPTVMDLPWAEYSPVPTQFGLANPRGESVYLSDPLESYHSHIFVSADAALLCGEGTHDHSFVYAARFDRQTTRIDFVPHATIHTTYYPLAGQSVNAGFTADGRWLLYNDTLDGEHHVCAVRVDVG